MDSGSKEQKRTHGAKAGRSFFSPKDNPDNVFIPHKQCIEASGDCFVFGKCLSACKKHYPEKGKDND